jgi:hypothetical protein
MGVEAFMAITEAALQGALEAVLKSVQELDELPRPLFKAVMEKVRERGKELFPPVPLGGGVALRGEVAVSASVFRQPDGGESKRLILGLSLEKGSDEAPRIILMDVVFRLRPQDLREPARKVLSQLASETPGEVLRVVEALEAWAERARGLLREVEAEYAATLEREKEALEALRLRAAIRGLAEE